MEIVATFFIRMGLCQHLACFINTPVKEANKANYVSFNETKTVFFLWKLLRLFSFEMVFNEQFTQTLCSRFINKQANKANFTSFSHWLINETRCDYFHSNNLHKC